MKPRALSLFLLFAAACTALAQSLDQKIAAVLPSKAEDLWLEIPWRTNIADALTEASHARKPILLWVMNGNPLGCA